MKKLLVLMSAVIFTASVSMVNAQAYKHSIGATMGSMNGISYKTFVTGNFAISVDLGVKLTEGAFGHDGYYGYHYSYSVFDFEANPNFMYEANAVADLYWFVGGGISLGYGFGLAGYNSDCGKFGINAIGGIEYKFGIPLTLQFDFRPGFGMLFNNYSDVEYFDWGVNLGIRYAF